jgi:hypothetical protein
VSGLNTNIERRRGYILMEKMNLLQQVLAREGGRKEPGGMYIAYVHRVK